MSTGCGITFAETCWGSFLPLGLSYTEAVLGKRPVSSLVRARVADTSAVSCTMCGRRHGPTCSFSLVCAERSSGCRYKRNLGFRCALSINIYSTETADV